jgi:glycerol-3-phosphate dehydrogenase
MVDRVEKELQWPHKKTGTRHLSIHGSVANVDQNDPLYFYGSDMPQVKALMNGHAGQWLSSKLQIHEAQVKWAVQHEMARTVEDVLSRRTRALLLDARESMRMAEPVAIIMAKELHKDESWIKEQVDAYTKLAEGYVLK